MPRFLTVRVVCYEEPDGEVKQVGETQHFNLLWLCDKLMFYLIQEIGLFRSTKEGQSGNMSFSFHF